jgi:hypothetical protein
MTFPFCRSRFFCDYNAVSASNRITNKKPAYRTTSAAGKYLNTMDLPLARPRPSPPYRLCDQKHFACQLAVTLPIGRGLVDLEPDATRPRFEFVTRVHRESCDSIAIKKISIAVAVISRIRRIVKKRMIFDVKFLAEGLLSG